MSTVLIAGIIGILLRLIFRSKPTLKSTPLTETGTRLLTTNEVRVIELLVQGYRDKDIAKELGWDEQKVKAVLRTVYDKLDVHGRLELAMFAVQHQLLRKG